jgi:hypothetical protein
MKNVSLVLIAAALSACESARTVDAPASPAPTPAAPVVSAPEVVGLKASSLVIKNGSTVVAYIVGIGGWGTSSSNFAITVLTPQGYVQRVDAWTGELFSENLSRYYTSVDCSGTAYVDKKGQTPFMHLRFGNVYYKTHQLTTTSAVTLQSRLSSGGTCEPAATDMVNIVSLDEITAPSDYSDLAPLQLGE